MAQKNLVISLDALAQQFKLSKADAKELMEDLKYTTLMALSDGKELVVFIPEKNSANILEGKKMWGDLIENAPSRAKLIELGIIKDS